MDIPPWWLAISGFCFAANAVLFVFLCVAVVQFMKFLKDIGPRVESLEKSTQELIVNVQGVAKRVDEVAASVKETVDSVGGKARGVASSAELVAATASRQIEKFSPVITGIMTAIKVAKAVKEYRSAKSERKDAPRSKDRKKSGLAVYKR